MTTAQKRQRSNSDGPDIGQTSLASPLTVSPNFLYDTADVQVELHSSEILHYCYPSRVPPWSLNFPDDLKFVGALDKYEIWRGIEALEAAFTLAINIREFRPERKLSRRSENWPDSHTAGWSLFFAKHLSLKELAKLSWRYLLDALTWERVQPFKRSTTGSWKRGLTKVLSLVS